MLRSSRLFRMRQAAPIPCLSERKVRFLYAKSPQRWGLFVLALCFRACRCAKLAFTFGQPVRADLAVSDEAARRWVLQPGERGYSPPSTCLALAHQPVRRGPVGSLLSATIGLAGAGAGATITELGAWFAVWLGACADAAGEAASLCGGLRRREGLALSLSPSGAAAGASCAEAARVVSSPRASCGLALLRARGFLGLSDVSAEDCSVGCSAASTDRAAVSGSLATSGSFADLRGRRREGFTPVAVVSAGVSLGTDLRRGRGFAVEGA